jgi:ribonuclease Z
VTSSSGGRRSNPLSYGRRSPSLEARIYASRMDLSIVFLGTGGSVPTARRATACILVRRGGERLLFDCGEGAQRQMHRSTGLVQLDEIYLSHFHADHYLGIPGLLKTYDLQDRERPLRIYGPRGLIELFKAIARIIGKTRYPVELIELDEGEAVAHDGYEVRAFPVRHRIKALGYALAEPDRPGRFDPDAATRLGVEEGPAFGALQRGEEVQGANGLVQPSDVMGEARRGRRIVLSGDSTPTPETAAAAQGAEVLIHDGSFGDDQTARAAETGHSTAREAATLAREAEVKLLALVHASSRYNVSDLVREAREVFPRAIAPRDFDLVEVPFPERGEPELVPKGALERGPDRRAEPVPEL